MTSEKKKMDRRAFLKAAGIGSASLAVSTGLRGNCLAAEPDNDNSSKKMPTRILGKTGASLSILGMGGDVDYTINQTLLRMSLSMGINKGYTLEQAKLKAVWENENITAIASLIPNMTILKDNVAAAFDNKPLSSGDINILNRLAEYIRKNLAVRDYSHAEHVCPNKIQIGKAMREAARILG